MSACEAEAFCTAEGIGRVIQLVEPAPGPLLHVAKPHRPSLFDSKPCGAKTLRDPVMFEYATGFSTEADRSETVGVPERLAPGHHLSPSVLRDDQVYQTAYRGLCGKCGQPRVVFDEPLATEKARSTRARP